MSAPASASKRSLRALVLKSLKAAAKRRHIVVEELSDYHYRLTAPNGLVADYWPTTQRMLFKRCFIDNIDAVDAIWLLADSNGKAGQ